MPGFFETIFNAWLVGSTHADLTCVAGWTTAHVGLAAQRLAYNIPGLDAEWGRGEQAAVYGKCHDSARSPRAALWKWTLPHLHFLEGGLEWGEVPQSDSRPTAPLLLTRLLSTELAKNAAHQEPVGGSTKSCPTLCQAHWGRPKCGRQGSCPPGKLI